MAPVLCAAVLLMLEPIAQRDLNDLKIWVAEGVGIVQTRGTAIENILIGDELMCEFVGL